MRKRRRGTAYACSAPALCAGAAGGGAMASRPAQTASPVRPFFIRPFYPFFSGLLTPPPPFHTGHDVCEYDAPKRRGPAPKGGAPRAAARPRSASHALDGRAAKRREIRAPPRGVAATRDSWVPPAAEEEGEGEGQEEEEEEEGWEEEEDVPPALPSVQRGSVGMGLLRRAASLPPPPASYMDTGLPHPPHLQPSGDAREPAPCGSALWVDLSDPASTLLLPTGEEKGYLRAYFIFQPRALMPLVCEEDMLANLAAHEEAAEAAITAERARAVAIGGRPNFAAAYRVAGAAVSASIGPPRALAFRALYHAVVAFGAAVAGRKGRSSEYLSAARAYAGPCMLVPVEYTVSLLYLLALLLREGEVLQSGIMRATAGLLALTPGMVPSLSLHLKQAASFIEYGRIMQTTGGSGGGNTLVPVPSPVPGPPSLVQEPSDRIVHLGLFVACAFRSDFAPVPDEAGVDALIANLDELEVLSKTHGAWLPLTPTFWRPNIRAYLALRQGRSISPSALEELVVVYRRVGGCDRIKSSFLSFVMAARLFCAAYSAWEKSGEEKPWTAAGWASLSPSSFSRLIPFAAVFLSEACSTGLCPLPPDIHVASMLAGKHARVDTGDAVRAIVGHAETLCAMANTAEPVGGQDCGAAGCPNMRNDIKTIADAQRTIAAHSIGIRALPLAALGPSTFACPQEVRPQANLACLDSSWGAGAGAVMSVGHPPAAEWEYPQGEDAGTFQHARTTTVSRAGAGSSGGTGGRAFESMGGGGHTPLPFSFGDLPPLSLVSSSSALGSPVLAGQVGLGTVGRPSYGPAPLSPSHSLGSFGMLGLEEGGSIYMPGAQVGRVAFLDTGLLNMPLPLR